MTTSSISRMRVSLVALVAMAVLALGAVSAQAARVSYKGGTTTVTPSAAAVKALSDAGVAVAPIKPATASGGAFSFPIAKGFVNPKTGRAALLHRGGLKFTKGSKSLALRRFVLVKGKGRKATLLARVPRHRRYMAIARVTNAEASSDGKTVTGTLRITRTTARAFNKVAGKRVAKAGDVLGTGSSTVKSS